MKINEIITEGLMYRGYPCTKDCSGHMAGYEWARAHNVSDPAECPIGHSNSFTEGCRSYAEGNG